MGIGHALRSHREQKRVSLATISRATNIRLDYLEHIEGDAFDRLPPGAYGRGFIRAYATYLGIDSAPLIAEYERRTDPPAPEMAAVVRQPVELPRAVQPRTWRMAAGAGVAILLLLGVLGAVRSSDNQARPPLPSAAEVAALTTEDDALPTANPAGAVVRVEVVGKQAWVQSEADGVVTFAGTLTIGAKKVFRGSRSVYLVVGNARSVKLTVNGKDVGSPQGSTYRGTFTPTTAELPASQAR